MSVPVLTLHMLEHRIDHGQWCAGCQFDAAVTVSVTFAGATGVTTATKTACPRCGAGLNPKESPS